MEFRMVRLILTWTTYTYAMYVALVLYFKLLCLMKDHIANVSTQMKYGMLVDWKSNTVLTRPQGHT